MANFSTKTKARAWVVTVHEANMQKTGMTKEEYKNPEFLADFLAGIWEVSGKGRTAGVAVCVSADGLYHAHCALYGNLTTLANVAKIMFDSHVEPQLGGKKELSGYLLKQGKYAEKGEVVLHTKGIENVKDVQGKREDLEAIEKMLAQGFTPEQIFDEKLAYRRYERMVKSAYLAKRIKETPVEKQMHVEWHLGESGTGKTFVYHQLCKEHGRGMVYFATDYDNGGLDLYTDKGAPPILFMDEFKGNMRFGQLLIMLDKQSDAQIHCRYANCYCLWTSVYITSIYPPDEAYRFMVDESQRARDDIAQLLRRIHVVVYHFKEGENFKTFSIPADKYTTYDELKQMAHADENGFISVDDIDVTPPPFE